MIFMQVQGFLHKLKEGHLLPRIKTLLSEKNKLSSVDVPVAGTTALTSMDISELDQIFFKYDRIYRHNLLRINYTTYDVRRGCDFINPTTSRRDIMVLTQISKMD